MQKMSKTLFSPPLHSFWVLLQFCLCVSLPLFVSLSVCLSLTHTYTCMHMHTCLCQNLLICVSECVCLCVWVYVSLCDVQYISKMYRHKFIIYLIWFQCTLEFCLLQVFRVTCSQGFNCLVKIDCKLCSLELW